MYNLKTKAFEDSKWKDLVVGNIIKVKKNETLPADILVIKSSHENGFCYFQTTNLDGYIINLINIY
jgi:magnesium-transporting ATPase (P-type)